MSLRQLREVDRDASRLATVRFLGFRLLGDVHFAKSKSFCNSVAYRSFSVQNHIQVSTINAVVLCKCDLTPLALDCGAQQTNNLIIVKNKFHTAQTAAEGNCMSFDIVLGRHHGLAPRPKTQTPIRGENSGSRYRIKGLSVKAVENSATVQGGGKRRAVTMSADERVSRGSAPLAPLKSRICNSARC